MTSVARGVGLAAIAVAGVIGCSSAAGEVMGPPQTPGFVPSPVSASTDPLDLDVAPGDDLATLVAEVPPGSTLRLAAGDHHLDEPLVIARPLTLVGQGSARTRLVSTASEVAVLVVDVAAVELRDLQVRHRADDVVASVQIATTAYRLQDVTLRAEGATDGDGAGLLLHPAARHGPPAPELTRRAADGWDGRADGLTVTGYGGAGIIVAGAAVPTLTAVAVTGAAGCGLCYVGEAGGSLEGAELSDNDVGLSVAATAAPQRLTGLQLSGNRVGVWVDADGQATLESSEVVDSVAVGVVIADRAQAVLEDTAVRGGTLGVEVRDQGRLTLLEVTLATAEEAAGVVRDNGWLDAAGARCEAAPLDLVLFDDGAIDDPGSCGQHDERDPHP